MCLYVQIDSKTCGLVFAFHLRATAPLIRLQVAILFFAYFTPHTIKAVGLFRQVAWVVKKQNKKTNEENKFAAKQIFDLTSLPAAMGQVLDLSVCHNNAKTVCFLSSAVQQQWQQIIMLCNMHILKCLHTYMRA